MNEELLIQTCQSYQGPMYIFDLDIAKKVCERFVEKLQGQAKLCYAMKTNPFLVAYMEPLVDRIEVCSMGEFRICQSLSIAKEKLLISGVLKRQEDMEEILAYLGNNAFITLESLEHVRIVNEIAERLNIQINVYPRLSSGNQFGMDRETITELIQNRNKYSHFTFAGLHYFSGTQKKSTKKNCKELGMLCDFLVEIKDRYGFVFPELEYGSGEKVAYFEGDEDTRFDDMEVLANEIRRLSIPAQVTLEMGRAFAADCGYYLTKIWDIKKIEENNYCIVDGGMHHLNYDGQIRGMYKPNIITLQLSDKSSKASTFGSDEEAEKMEKYTICGALCTGNDILLSGWETEKKNVGDVLAFCNAGAYSMTEGASLFLSHDLPKVITYSNEHGFSVLRDHVETWKLNTNKR